MNIIIVDMVFFCFVTIFPQVYISHECLFSKVVKISKIQHEHDDQCLLFTVIYFKNQKGF